MLRLSTRLFSSSSKASQQLALRPKEWIDLPAEEILKLSKTRRYLLGSDFKFDQDELNALKSTSKHTGVSQIDIEKLYYRGERAACEISGSRFEDDHTPQPFEFDEYPEAAQEIIREHREQREYNRIAAYEMPHLAKYRQQYVPPVDKPVTFKYTSYVGEDDYEANRKVVLTVKVKDLKLGEKETHKFKVLSGSRYDYSTDVFKIATDRFTEPLQNTRYLSDVLKRLIEESRDLKDDLSDIPLDIRHTQARLKKSRARKHEKLKLSFPESWKRPQDAPVVEKGVLDYLHELEYQRALSLIHI